MAAGEVMLLRCHVVVMSGRKPAESMALREGAACIFWIAFKSWLFPKFMKTHKIFLLAAAALCGVGFSSCTMNSAGGGLSSYQAYDRPAKLPESPSAVEVKVSLSRQRAYVVESGEMLMAMPITVGAPDSPTPAGTFRIFYKEEKHRAKSHGYAYRGSEVKKSGLENKPSGWSFKGTPMPYWCEFKTGYGFHTGWVKHFPYTNDGCIRMHENLAPKFYRLVSVGTPVNISYRQPEDAKWANMLLPPDAGPLRDHESSMYVGDGYFTHHKTPVFD